MTITLGDKIEIIIENARAWSKEVHNDRFYADEILKLFEKLIDSTVDQYVIDEYLGKLKEELKK